VESEDESRIRGFMRLILIALMLSACSAYPRIDWPAGGSGGPSGGAAPALLPQSEFAPQPAGADTGAALGARAAALRGWAASVAR
jgi:hypothetical protein